jgi:hypothetical protein
MQSLFSPPGSGAVQAFRLASVTPALGTGNLLLDVSIEMPCLKLISITRGCDVLEPQVDPHHLF